MMNGDADVGASPSAIILAMRNNDQEVPCPLSPVPPSERFIALDAIRGIALLGVLLVNLVTFFRVSLFEHILDFHTHPGWNNRATDILIAWSLEFKAFTLFSFLFGVGVGIQAERMATRGVRPSHFLIRRFVVLLAIGLCNLLLVSNSDILALYAICGLLLIPFVERSTNLLVAFGLVAISLSFAPPFENLIPSSEAMRAHVASATRVYATGGYLEILELRWHETWQFIFPLLVSSLPKTLGLMLLGIAAWRTGILKRPADYRILLWIIFFVAGTLGAGVTTLLVWSRETGFSLPVPEMLEAISYIPLAFAFGAGLLLWLSDGSAGWLIRLFAAAGQMALSNYLAQSIIFGWLFYGFGFGLFGSLGSAITALIGIAVYAGQLFASYVWLQHFRFGPAEWIWRSLTYGSWQRMQRTA